MSELTMGRAGWSPDFKGTPGAPPVVPVGLKEHPAYKAGYAEGLAEGRRAPDPQVAALRQETIAVCEWISEKADSLPQARAMARKWLLEHKYAALEGEGR